MHFQIGTAEPHGVIGSRAARSDNWNEALEECRQRSMSRSVKEAWIRPVSGGRMGKVLATFIKGEQQCAN